GGEKNNEEHPLETVIRELAQLETSDVLPHGWIAETISTDPAVWALGVPTADLDALVAKVNATAAAAATTTDRKYDVLLRVAATGGGALRLKDELESKLSVAMVVVHELQALVRGWLPTTQDIKRQTPALVCNVGTGVSVVHVTAKDDDPVFERVSGSGIGASTFWALAKRMTSFDSFEQAVVAAMTDGDAQKVDILVGDIYGVETSKAIGMPPDLVAGFLGNLDNPDLTDADIVAALLRMFANNLAQLAVFQARLLDLDCVWFSGGCFGSVRKSVCGSVQDADRDDETCACMGFRKAVEQSVGFWSAGKIAAKFPDNSSFVGAAGAVLEASSTKNC
ncbi:hypothetical protein EV175_006339, partial [Coemansia sp. RSA 1933]